MRRGLAVLTLVTIALAACGGGGKPTARPTTKPLKSSKTFEETDLSGLVLVESDAPGDTAFLEDRAGVLTLEEFWGCCKEQHDDFVSFGYRTGYRTAFQQDELPEEVADWDAGVAFANSVVTLFDDTRGASRAMPVWRDFFKASAEGKTKKTSPGLGDEGTGLTGEFFKEDQQMVIYFWRVGNVVFHLRIGGRAGTIETSDARRLARKMAARA